jgi:glycosyltransferase involved in cell wall biosynthesis
MAGESGDAKAGSASGADTRRAAPMLVLAANDPWNIVNYRAGLIRALQAAGYRVAVLAPEGPHAAAIAELGADFHPVEMTARGTSPVADLGVLVNYVRRLRKLRPAAFLGFTAKPNIYGSIAASLCGVPVINNISGLGTVFASRTLLTRIVVRLYRLALRRSGTVFFQNCEDQALFEQLHVIEPSRAVLLPGSGVDLAYFAPWGGKTDPRFTFLFAARLLWDKGIGEFVEAARRIRRLDRNVRFRILGRIEPKSRAAVGLDRLSEWQAEGVIEYAGSAEDVRPIFAESDCVVLPTYYREGVPRVLLEAAAMAIPAITSDGPGCRDAVDHGATGLLCEPRSIDSLTAAMELMLGMTPDERARMGSAGRRKMALQFREEIVHRAYLDALGELGLSGS